MKRILFLCTGNSCRSQMAEGFARQLKGKELEVHSAGIETHGLNPIVVKVMAEVGVDISQQYSKHVNEVLDVDFDYVVTVCDHASENCPLFSARSRVVHHSFDDPSQLALQATNQEESLGYYRQVCDQIRAFVEVLPGVIECG